jgi:hypothetical protein
MEEREGESHMQKYFANKKFKLLIITNAKDDSEDVLSYFSLRMCVCMYVSMYICMYVCTYVRMYVFFYYEWGGT